MKLSLLSVIAITTMLVVTGYSFLLPVSIESGNNQGLFSRDAGSFICSQLYNSEVTSTEFMEGL